VQAQISKPKLCHLAELLTTASTQTAPPRTSWCLLCVLPFSSSFFSLHSSFMLLQFNYILAFCNRKTGHSTPKQLFLAGQENKTNDCRWHTTLCSSLSNSRAPREGDQPETCFSRDGDMEMGLTHRQKRFHLLFLLSFGILCSWDFFSFSA